MTYAELEQKHAKQIRDFLANSKNDTHALEGKLAELIHVSRQQDQDGKSVEKVMEGLDERFKEELYNLRQLTIEQTKEKTNYLVVMKAFDTIHEFEDGEKKGGFERD